MADLTYKIIFMVLYVLAAATRAPYAYQVKKMKIKTTKRKEFEIFLLAVGSAMMILPLIVVFSDWFVAYNMNLPTWARDIALVGFAGAVFLHGWSHKALSIYWSPGLEIKKGHHLITSGPYKYLRHPMYSAFLLWSIFQGLVLSNWVVLFGGVASMAFIYLNRVNAEEKLMIDEFGGEYRKYMKHTGRLFPRF